jgi:hypothetical protein
MRSHKSLEKGLKSTSIENIQKVMTDVYTWEFENEKIFAGIQLPEREMLFPTVAVWGTKNSNQ